MKKLWLFLRAFFGFNDLPVELQPVRVQIPPPPDSRPSPSEGIFGLDFSRIFRRSKTPLESFSSPNPTETIADALKAAPSARKRTGAGLVGRSPEAPPELDTVRRPANAAPPNYAGGRVSSDNPESTNVGLDLWAAFARNKSYRRYGLKSSFDIDDFADLDLDFLAELLIDLSPEVSAAFWNYQLLCNNGFEVNCYRPGTQDIDQSAQQAAEEMLATLGENNGTANVFFDKCFMSFFLRGALCTELVLGLNGRDFADIAVIDPKTLYFKRVKDEVRGSVWDFGQKINGVDVSLRIPTVKYVPLHPLPNSIEGRPLVTPAFFIAMFLMAVLRDVKRVIQNQGYVRTHATVALEELAKSMPPAVANDPSAFKAWVDKTVAQVEIVVNGLEPDDMYVSTDVVKMTSVGAATSQSIQAIDGFLSGLERMAARALKTMPLMLGVADSGNETNSNRQYEFALKGAEIIQHLVELTVGGQIQQALRAQGKQAEVELRFAQMRASERFRDTQADFLNAKFARFLFDCGYISQDDAAKRAADVDKADSEEPRDTSNSAVTGIGSLGNQNPEDIADRIVKAMKTKRMPTDAEVDESVDIWKKYAPDEAVNLIVAELEPVPDGDAPVDEIE